MEFDNSGIDGMRITPEDLNDWRGLRALLQQFSSEDRATTVVTAPRIAIVPQGTKQMPGDALFQSLLEGGDAADAAILERGRQIDLRRDLAEMSAYLRSMLASVVLLRDASAGAWRAVAVGRASDIPEPEQPAIAAPLQVLRHGASKIISDGTEVLQQLHGEVLTSFDALPQPQREALPRRFVALRIASIVESFSTLISRVHTAVEKQATKIGLEDDPTTLLQALPALQNGFVAFRTEVLGNINLARSGKMWQRKA